MQKGVLSSAPVTSAAAWLLPESPVEAGEPKVAKRKRSALDERKAEIGEARGVFERGDPDSMGTSVTCQTDRARQ